MIHASHLRRIRTCFSFNATSRSASQLPDTAHLVPGAQMHVARRPSPTGRCRSLHSADLGRAGILTRARWVDGCHCPSIGSNTQQASCVAASVLRPWDLMLAGCGLLRLGHRCRSARRRHRVFECLACPHPTVARCGVRLLRATLELLLCFVGLRWNSVGLAFYRAAGYRWLAGGCEAKSPHPNQCSSRRVGSYRAWPERR